MRCFYFILFHFLFVFVFILFEHPWHAIDVFVRLPECRFNSAIILLPKKVFYFTLVYLETERLISSSSVAAGNGVSVTPIGHVLLCFANEVKITTPPSYSSIERTRSTYYYKLFLTDDPAEC